MWQSCVVGIMYNNVSNKQVTTKSGMRMQIGFQCTILVPTGGELQECLMLRLLSDLIRGH